MTFFVEQGFVSLCIDLLTLDKEFAAQEEKKKGIKCVIISLIAVLQCSFKFSSQPSDLNVDVEEFCESVGYISFHLCFYEHIVILMFLFVKTYPKMLCRVLDKLTKIIKDKSETGLMLHYYSLFLNLIFLLIDKEKEKDLFKMKLKYISDIFKIITDCDYLNIGKSNRFANSLIFLLFHYLLKSNFPTDLMIDDDVFINRLYRMLTCRSPSVREEASTLIRQLLFDYHPTTIKIKPPTFSFSESNYILNVKDIFFIEKISLGSLLPQPFKELISSSEYIPKDSKKQPLYEIQQQIPSSVKDIENKSEFVLFKWDYSAPELIIPDQDYSRHSEVKRESIVIPSNTKSRRAVVICKLICELGKYANKDEVEYYECIFRLLGYLMRYKLNENTELGFSLHFLGSFFDTSEGFSQAETFHIKIIEILKKIMPESKKAGENVVRVLISVYRLLERYFSLMARNENIEKKSDKILLVYKNSEKVTDSLNWLFIPENPKKETNLLIFDNEIYAFFSVLYIVQQFNIDNIYNRKQLLLKYFNNHFYCFSVFFYNLMCSSLSNPSPFPLTSRFFFFILEHLVFIANSPGNPLKKELLRVLDNDDYKRVEPHILLVFITSLYSSSQPQPDLFKFCWDIESPLDIQIKPFFEPYIKECLNSIPSFSELIVAKEESQIQTFFMNYLLKDGSIGKGIFICLLSDPLKAEFKNPERLEIYRELLLIFLEYFIFFYFLGCEENLVSKLSIIRKDKQFMELFLKGSKPFSSLFPHHIDNSIVKYLLFEKKVKSFPKINTLPDLSILDNILFFTCPCFPLWIRTSAVRLMVLYLPLYIFSVKNGEVEKLSGLFYLFLIGINLVVDAENVAKEKTEPIFGDRPLTLYALEGNDDEFGEYVNLIFCFLFLMIWFSDSVLSSVNKLLYVGESGIKQVACLNLYKETPTGGSDIGFSKLYIQMLTSIEMIVFFFLGNILRIPHAKVIKVGKGDHVVEKYSKYFPDKYKIMTKLLGKTNFNKKLM
jgi:hypothetical protein